MCLRQTPTPAANDLMGPLTLSANLGSILGQSETVCLEKNHFSTSLNSSCPFLLFLSARLTTFCQQNIPGFNISPLIQEAIMLCGFVTWLSIQSLWKRVNSLGNGIKTVHDIYSCWMLNVNFRYHGYPPTWRFYLELSFQYFYGVHWNGPRNVLLLPCNCSRKHIRSKRLKFCLVVSDSERAYTFHALLKFLITLKTWKHLSLRVLAFTCEGESSFIAMEYLNK